METNTTPTRAEATPSACKRESRSPSSTRPSSAVATGYIEPSTAATARLPAAAAKAKRTLAVVSSTPTAATAGVLLAPGQGAEQGAARTAARSTQSDPARAPAIVQSGEPPATEPASTST